MELTKIKIENKISKRQLVIQLFSLCLGGTIGLLFLSANLKSGILLALGLYYCFILLKNYISLDKQIDNLIKEMENKL